MSSWTTTLAVPTVSEVNRHEHWRKSHKRHALQKESLRIAWLQDRPDIQLPCEVTFTRISPKHLDSDNLPVAFKWYRDTIADLLIPGYRPGMADDDSRISWHYRQERGKAVTARVMVEWAQI